MIKILLIEDDADIIEAVVIFLRMHLPETNVVSTHLGKVGIVLAKDENPDVIILDIGLPDIDGFEVLKQIRSFSSVPIIILTVISDQNNINKGIALGADYYIVKPFKHSTLLASIKAATAR